MQASEERILVNDGSEALLPDQSVSNSTNADVSAVSPPSQQHKMEYKEIAFGASEPVRNGQGNSLETGSPISVNLRQNSVPGQNREASSIPCLLDPAKFYIHWLFLDVYLVLFLARRALVLK